MNARTYIVVCLAMCLGSLATAQDFHEGWETAQITNYVPSPTTFINGDEGAWRIGDTISQSPECERTRNQAQILVQNGTRVLRLLSNRSFTQCPDDIWVLLTEFDSTNQGFGIPLTPTTIISFDERGWLEDPRLHDGGVNCPVPPCFDNISLLLTDNNGNILAYVLQRFPGALENVPNIHFGDRYREIFLDPDAGTYKRNLFSDFQRIRTFDPNGAQIRSIEFRVDEHGWAIIDNIIIDSATPNGSVPVHRFWSPVLLSHFYTASESERQAVVNLYPHIWTYEGFAFYALPENGGPSLSPVYRFWSPVFLSHFYTINEAERDTVLDEYPDIWLPEGIAFHAFAQGAQPDDAAAVYRFWSPVLARHFYTISEAERDTVIVEYPDLWSFEGIAWYAYPP
jgi:hypothetical protein